MLFAQLEAFVEVARTGNFSHAAKSLGLSQPTVAARIDALEGYLKEQLLVRGSRGMQLTDAGRLLRPYAERSLKSMVDARQALVDLRIGSAGRLALGAAPVVSTYVLPHILKRFTRVHPAVELAVKTGHPEQVLSMVLAGEVQVGLVPALQHPDIETMPLYEDELVLVCAHHHPFAERQSVTLSEIGRERMVASDRAPMYFEVTQMLLRARRNGGWAVLDMDNAEAVKRVVEEGLGIAFLPRAVVRREIGTGRLAEVAIADAPCMRRQVIAIRHRGAGPPGGVVSAFLRELRLEVQPASRGRLVQVAD